MLRFLLFLFPSMLFNQKVIIQFGSHLYSSTCHKMGLNAKYETFSLKLLL